MIHAGGAAGVEFGRVVALRTGRAHEGMSGGGCPPRTLPQHALRATLRVQPAEPRLYAWLRAHDVNRFVGGPCSVGSAGRTRDTVLPRHALTGA